MMLGMILGLFTYIEVMQGDSGYLPVVENRMEKEKKHEMATGSM